MKIGEVEFGSPWRPDDKYMGFVVPIKRKGKVKRAYITFEEVKDKAKITDTGRINKARIEIITDKPVFIRTGTVFEGVGTQSRAVNSSMVIMPKKVPVEVPVSCVHASHGIRTGSAFRAGGINAPAKVTRSLFSGRGQGEVWNSVSRYSAMASLGADRASHSGMAFDVGHDNLVGAVRSVERAKGDINDIISKMPIEKNQIGIVIFDLNGVVGIEMFDSPESWKAVSESVIKKYGETLTEKQEEPLFELKVENVIPKIVSFVEMLNEGEGKVVFKEENVETKVLETSKVVAEWTTIDKKIIHMIASKNDEKRPPIRRPPQPFQIARLGTGNRFRSARPITEHPYRAPVTTGGVNTGVTYDILNSMSHGESQWSDIHKDSKVSHTTLSNKLKEFNMAGLVEKRAEMRLGRAATLYSLTDKGARVLDGLSGIKKKLIYE